MDFWDVIPHVLWMGFGFRALKTIDRAIDKARVTIEKGALKVDVTTGDSDEESSKD